ncbi:MAG: glycosyltransferase family 39 protein [Bacteroidales bacterium]|nr:glycosyltransferase family 39 protein [Bacteroidales bacterium]
MKSNYNPYIVLSIILALGGLLFIPFSGAVYLFDWDEVIFAEAAREMISSGDYLTVTINFEPFWEKPPLFIWLQVLSMKIFGINEFAARFPNAIAGIITLASVYLIGRKVRGDKLGILWAAAYLTAILPFFYFQTGIIDPWFNLFIFLGISFFIFYLVSGGSFRRYLDVALSAFFLGLAILTKGPVAGLIFLLSFGVFLIYRKGKIQIRAGHVVVFILVVLITGGSWFLISALNGNLDIIKEFIAYQVGLFSEDFAGNKGFPGFHFVVLLFGVFPSSVVFIASITKKKESDELLNTYRIWMFVILAVVLVFFSLVATKLVHYSSLAYYPVTFLAAWQISQWTDRKVEIKKWQIWILGTVSILIGMVAIVVPVAMLNKEWILDRFSGLLNLYFEGVVLAEAGWGILDFLPGIIFLTGAIFAIYRIANRTIAGIFYLQLTTLIFTYSSIMLFVPKFQTMAQSPAIEYFIENSESEMPAISLGYPSFAQYYYGRCEPGELPLTDKHGWISRQDSSIHVVMMRDNYKNARRRYPSLRVTGAENGFVFGVIEKEGR